MLEGFDQALPSHNLDLATPFIDALSNAPQMPHKCLLNAVYPAQSFSYTFSRDLNRDGPNRLRAQPLQQ
jgi:hypothetical protein